VILSVSLLCVLALELSVCAFFYSVLSGYIAPAFAFILVLLGLVFWRSLLVFLTFLISRGYRGRSWATFTRVFFYENLVVAYLYTFAQAFLPLTQLFAKRVANPTGPVIVLIHGFVCNAGMWGAMRKHLHNQAFSRVFTVNLDPLYLKMERSLADFEGKLREILQDQNVSEAILIGHSMGGVLARVFQNRHPELVHAAVSIGAPHAGTDLARLVSTIHSGPLRPDSAWLLQFSHTQNAELQDQRLPALNIWSDADNIVFPQGNAALNSGNERKLADIGHLHLAFAPAALKHVSDFLTDFKNTYDSKPQ
jgi:predicted alpha/beta hydrolase family esterase